MRKSKIQVYDPPLCCSSGVCGTEVDQTLVDFSAAFDAVKRAGGDVARYNLAQQPLEFAQNAVVRAFLERSGQEGLPLVLVDGEIVLSGRYPGRDELLEWAGIAAAPSLFTEQVAELVAIGAAIACNCEPCFKYHYDKARKLGVSDADMRRAVDMAQMVKDSPARAMLDLAQRYLGPSTPATEVKPAPCCSPEAAPQPGSKCG